MQKTNYLIPKEHQHYKAIEEAFSPMLELLVQQPKKNFSLTVPANVVSSKETAFINEIVMLAQHKKEWVHRMLFGIKLKFQKSPDSEEIYEDGEWQIEKDIQLWIRKVGEGIPVSCFFLQEWEARYLCITGDIFADDRMKILDYRDDGRLQLETTVEDQRVIIDRIADASKMFLFYCHPSGFDPKQAIEAILAEFKIPLEFEMIKEMYDEEVRNGIFIHAIARK